MTPLDDARARYRTDCRHFRGEKPCGLAEACTGCEHHAPMGTRILVIKLAAIGDVLRTTPVLEPLRRQHQPCHVTWLTDPGAAELLAGTPQIDRLLTYRFESVLELLPQEFDLLVCLDKEPRATAVAMQVRARRKLGFGMTEGGALTILNPESEHAYRLGLSDTLKFRENDRTYQHIVLDALALPTNPVPPYLISIPDDERRLAREQLRDHGATAGRRLVGLNTGCGPVFATKKWTEQGYLGLAAALAAEGDVTCVLLGGPDEVERNRRIHQRLRETGVDVADAGCDNTLLRFAAIVSCMDLLVTGDTLALHLGLATGVPTVAIMGSTSSAEIETYGRGTKVVTDFPCSPCYLKVCPLAVTCMEALPVELVLDACRDLLARAPRSERPTSEAP